MALTYLKGGDEARALTALTHYLAEAVPRATATPSPSAWATSPLLYTWQGHYLAAAPLYGRAIALARTLDTPANLLLYLYHAADYYTRQGRHAAAAPLNAEAARLAAATDNREFALKTALLDLYLRQARGATAPPAALREATALLAAWPAADEQAAILYTLWQLDPAPDAARQAAAGAYQALYATQPYVEYRQRYEALTGASLPPPPPLPDLPAAVAAAPDNLPVLLRRAGIG